MRVSTKSVAIVQTLGVALQYLIPQYVDSQSAATISHVAVGIGQLAMGFAALFSNPDGSPSREPYVKYRRKNNV